MLQRFVFTIYFILYLYLILSVTLKLLSNRSNASLTNARREDIMFPSGYYLFLSLLNEVHALFKYPVCCFVVAVSLFHDCTVCIMQISMYFCCTTPVAFFLKGRFLSLRLNYIFLFL